MTAHHSYSATKVKIEVAGKRVLNYVRLRNNSFSIDDFVRCAGHFGTPSASTGTT